MKKLAITVCCAGLACFVPSLAKAESVSAHIRFDNGGARIVYHTTNRSSSQHRHRVAPPHHHHRHRIAPPHHRAHWMPPARRSVKHYTQTVFVPVVHVPPAPTAAYCREYQAIGTVGGGYGNIYGTACYQPDGSWRIVK